VLGVVCFYVASRSTDLPLVGPNAVGLIKFWLKYRASTPVLYIKSLSDGFVEVRFAELIKRNHSSRLPSYRLGLRRKCDNCEWA